MQGADSANFDHEEERRRLIEWAGKSKIELLHTLNDLEWCNPYERNAIKCRVAPRSETAEFRAMGTCIIRRPPSVVLSFIMDVKSRAAWDKILNEHRIVAEFTNDGNQRTLLWTMKFRPRYLKMKRRVAVLACYAGDYPDHPGARMLSMMSVTTPLAKIGPDEVQCHIPVSGYIIVPNPADPSTSIITYVLRITILQNQLGFMERTLMRTISQWAPPHAVIDRLSTLRSLIEEKCVVSVVTTFPFMRESNFPPLFLRDFSYIKKDPLESRADVMAYYCGEDKDSKWVQVASDRGLVMKKFSGPLLHDRHNLALRLTFSTSNFIQFTLCLTDIDKRLIWEPCATSVEHIWDDGPMNVCLKVVGGGPAKGRGCPKFEVFVYHIYSYGMHGDTDIVDSCVYEEHSDGTILLALLTSPGNSTLIDVFFFINSEQFTDRSRTSLNFLPSTSQLPPIERMLLESVIEFRNVIELDSWLPSESIEKLSLSDIASKSISPQNRLSMELKKTNPSQKRKQRYSTAEDEEDVPLFGKMRNYINKLPSFASVFSSNPPAPAPQLPTPSALHLLFAAPPNAYMKDCINQLPYEILVHIFKFLPLDALLPCAQVCHRTWQVANLDSVWRDLMAMQAEKQKLIREIWDKYAPPSYPRTESPYSPPKFEVQIPPNSDASSDASGNGSWGTMSTDSGSRNSSWGAMSMDSRNNSCGNMIDDGELEDLSPEQKRESLKSLLDILEQYASPYKLQYLHSMAAEKCWKYGVASYVPCGALSGDDITCLSEQERDDTLLVACRSGVVRGLSAADAVSPTSRVLFSLSSQQHALQAQWRGDKVLAVFNNGELVEYDPATKTQKSRQFFTPMSGGFLYHNESSPSAPTLLVSHLREKLAVFDVDEGVRLLKWKSSRGEITNARVCGTRCVAVTAMPALYTLNMLDMGTGNLLACLSGHQDVITGVRLLDQGGNLVASSSKDGTVRVWDMRIGSHIAKQYCHAQGIEVNCFYTIPDKLVAGLSTGSVAYWDPRYINKPVASFALPPTARNKSITNVHVTRDQKRLVATWDSGLFSTWILHPR